MHVIEYLCFGELEFLFLVTVQATHAITVPTSSSTRSPITAPSALVIGLVASMEVVVGVAVAEICTAEL